MRYRFVITILALLLCQQAFTQVSPHPFHGSITTAGTDCSVATRCVTVTLPTGTASATIAVDADTGSFSGTLQFEGSVDGSKWIAMVPTSNSSTTSSSTTATGSWQFNPSSYIQIRARASARASGTAAIVINWGPAVASSGGGGSGTVTSVSSGGLTPLFTTGVATATTTPALSFTLTNAAANTVFGNNTSGSAAPGFQTSINVSGSIVAGTSLSSGTAPTTLGSATGGFAATCASTAGSAVAGQGYVRCDSTTGWWLVRHVNGGAEVPIGSAYIPAAASGAITAASITNGPSQMITCSATCSWTPITPPILGAQFCVTMKAGVTGTITLNALGNSAQYGKTDGSAYGTAGTGTAVSTSATGNRICGYASSTTTYETNGNGSFTMN